MSGQGVIFDLDGTLADTLPDIADALNAGLRAFGLPARPGHEVRGWIGEGMPMLCRRASGAQPDFPLDDLIAAVREHYRQNRLNKVKLYPGIPALLDELARRGVPMAILSNKPHEHTAAMGVALFGQWPMVAVEGCRVEQRRKPDPQTALEVAAQMNLPPAKILMVGDSFTDVTTALNAGMIPVGVTWGYRSRQELLEAGAKFLIDHAAALLDLL